MSNLPGNPHDNVNVDYADTNDGRISGEAILALAYEQRTANLIAAIDTLGISRAQIAERLGLESKPESRTF